MTVAVRARTGAVALRGPAARRHGLLARRARVARRSTIEGVTVFGPFAGAGRPTMLDNEVLLLNRLWQGINVVDGRRALSLLYSGKALAVDEEYATHDWLGWIEASEGLDAPDSEFVHTPSVRVRVPWVVQHRTYDRVPRPNVKFTRANIYQRDRFRCQYCGRRGRQAELNIDHIVPRSRGGSTTWENVVVACIDCNLRKGDNLPEEVGMRIARPPRRPRWHPAALLGAVEDPPPQWRAFLAGV